MDAIKHIRWLVPLICRDQYLVTCIGHRILEHLKTNSEYSSIHWLEQVANDIPKLTQCGGLFRAARSFMDEVVQKALTKVIYILERSCSLQSYFHMNLASQEQWRSLFMSDAQGWTELDGIPNPVRFGQYSVGVQVPLQLPFIGCFLSARWNTKRRCG